jgi:hypothetical protein
MAVQIPREGRTDKVFQPVIGNLVMHYLLLIDHRSFSSPHARPVIHMPWTGISGAYRDNFLTFSRFAA